MTMQMSSPCGSAPTRATAGSAAVPDARARVVGCGAEAVFRIPADFESVLHARKQVVHAARKWGPLDEAALGDLELCTAEIVANAVEHTGEVSVVRVSRTTRGVRVEVADTRPQLPEPAAPSSDGESGRGLLLVDALAAEWGAHTTAAGKTVWFEIAAAPQSTGSAVVRQAERYALGQPAAA
ncbi:ATP-binding protein [Streptomyces sp. NPDC006514]|uniref:ATP-binding protein n=1 Tax=Streptomyces sp. NPDC006514 TaxID=3154308 RepID=UPI0033A02E71